MEENKGPKNKKTTEIFLGYRLQTPQASAQQKGWTFLSMTDANLSLSLFGP